MITELLMFNVFLISVITQVMIIKLIKKTSPFHNFVVIYKNQHVELTLQNV